MAHPHEQNELNAPNISWENENEKFTFMKYSVCSTNFVQV